MAERQHLNHIDGQVEPTVEHFIEYGSLLAKIEPYQNELRIAAKLCINRTRC